MAAAADIENECTAPMTTTTPPDGPPPPPSPTTNGSEEDEPYTIFDKRQKALIVVISAFAATFSGFAGNSYFPALPALAADFNVSIDLINLTVTSYLLFQGLAPSLWGPISDVKGRRVAYFFTFIVLLGACIGLALAGNYPTLLVLRCLQSTGSASTIAIGSGVIGDITTRADRGGVMGVFQAGLLVPVAVGPVIGGALAGSLGWRSIFWCLAIYSGCFLVVLVLFLPETLRSVVGNGSRLPSGARVWTRYPLVFYQRRTTTATTIKWRTEDPPPSRRRENDPELVPDREGENRGTKGGRKKKSVDLMGPLRIVFSKQAAPMMFYTAVYYTVWQMAITAMSTLFEDKYGLDDTQIGLTFIGNGVGSVVGTLVTGRILNADYARVMERWKAGSSVSEPVPRSVSDTGSNSSGTADEKTTDRNQPNLDNSSRRSTADNDADPNLGVIPGPDVPEPQQQQTPPDSNTTTTSFPLEQARLSRLPYISLLQTLSILLFGWSLQYSAHVHIAIPIIATFIMGWTAVSTLSIATTYLVDIFHDKSAAAGASLNLVRCLLAAGGASFVMPLIGRIGVGWAFTVFVGVQGVATGGLVAQMRWGGKWREEGQV